MGVRLHRLWLLLIALLLALLLGPPARAQGVESSLGHFPVEKVVGMSGEESRSYHGVAVAKVKDTKWTHVAVCGVVTLAKREEDGDIHLRINDGEAFIVAEIVPYHPLPMPKKGQYVRIAGVSRFDKTHAWAEVHPVEAITVVGSCHS